MGDNNLRSYYRYLSKILPGLGPYDYRDKPACVSQYAGYMLDRTQSMFRWSGLPDSIPQRILELYLQSNGNVAWYRHDGILYVFTGGLGGPPDVYYQPTIYTIANPALKLSVQAEIATDCVLMRNDSLMLGLLPMYRKYATGMMETDISLDIATVNARIASLISAPDDRTKDAAETFLRQMADGKPGIIAENAFLDGIRAQPYGMTGHTTITDLIELMQYLKASWYNELGLDANYNMKRESLNSAESQLNNDALLPLVDDMLRCRQQAAEEVNAMFGTEISVDLASAWEDNQEELDAEHDVLDAESDPDGHTDPEEQDPEQTPGGDEDAETD